MLIALKSKMGEKSTLLRGKEHPLLLLLLRYLEGVLQDL